MLKLIFKLIQLIKSNYFSKAHWIAIGVGHCAVVTGRKLIGIDILQQSGLPLVLVGAKDLDLVQRHLTQQRFHDGKGH